MLRRAGVPGAGGRWPVGPAPHDASSAGVDEAPGDLRAREHLTCGAYVHRKLALVRVPTRTGLEFEHGHRPIDTLHETIDGAAEDPPGLAIVERERHLVLDLSTGGQR